MRMKVFIAGGSGLIGRAIVSRLVARGDEPIILSRRADEVRRDPSLRSLRFVQGDPTVAGEWASSIDGCDAVINLAGFNLFDKRWNVSVKQAIRDSRVLATEKLVAAVKQARQRPKVFVQGSAIGYYGPQGDEELTESSPSGSDFMSVVCREWEEAAKPAEDLIARVATIRTGVVLAKEAGALAVMTPIFKWLPGGAAPVGSGGKFAPASGLQWMSWIHLDDIAGLFLLGLDHPEAVGPINGTSPNPVRNVDFSRALAQVVKRPFLPFGLPDAILTLLLGEVADVVAKGQKVMPSRAAALGYLFKYPVLMEALAAVFAPPPKAAAKPAVHPHATAPHH